MKNKWKVQYNPMAGDKPYIVFRVKDIDKIVHSGNIEHYGDYMADKAEAQAIADKLNKAEEEIS